MADILVGIHDYKPNAEIRVVVVKNRGNPHCEVHIREYVEKFDKLMVATEAGVSFKFDVLPYMIMLLRKAYEENKNGTFFNLP